MQQSSTHVTARGRDAAVIHTCAIKDVDLIVNQKLVTYCETDSIASKTYGDSHEDNN